MDRPTLTVEGTWQGDPGGPSPQPSPVPLYAQFCAMQWAPGIHMWDTKFYRSLLGSVFLSIHLLLTTPRLRNISCYSFLGGQIWEGNHMGLGGGLRAVGQGILGF